MAIPFAIPAALSMVRSHWKLAVLAVVLGLLAIQTIRVGHQARRADRAEFHLREARAELMRISSAKNQQGETTQRNIVKARDNEAEAGRVAERIRNAPIEPGACKTPVEIMQEPNL
jgi:hypothetical protein